MIHDEEVKEGLRVRDGLAKYKEGTICKVVRTMYGISSIRILWDKPYVPYNPARESRVWSAYWLEKII